MKILIKGAGDLATGIAWRLKRCGFDICMTEIAVPTTVRRTVAFSRAVYEGEARVEGLLAVFAAGSEEVRQIVKEGDIAVLADPEAEIKETWQPDVVVDAILAKKNLGTRIDDAALVIGVGPGFTAGEDCHLVVETKRGHYLGRVIERGSAIPNTGIPGEVAGYTSERLIRAESGGPFKPVVSIGDTVKEGQVVASSGGVPIRAQMSGMVRGMLQAGVLVTEGMKCGDIDARCEREYCFTISDKARAIGGGVLEAILRKARQI
ncbi:selenium-dependent molybdenum cofactor biosynthesis protein YqeB [Diplocloster modestus]|uniref:EF2563 family selenium-dependent molybdenum hydroxylase system protein n=1 Tax=Diplocloster modestus TaxID=2850322 RepID=A0ABS6KBV2_9FIRM|nr:selenium-dependent molybdenum cofactor biosynthesis protein YqeB [Diplocloster modestus]MBU9727973.1 EF2563 family selenium-dependent molybdenum hydroxylase system protein [Diplocloster modestus]